MTLRTATSENAGSVPVSENQILRELTAPQVARMVGMDVDRVRRLLDRGEIVGYRTEGGRRRTWEPEVAEWQRRLREGK